MLGTAWWALPLVLMSACQAVFGLYDDTVGPGTGAGGSGAGGSGGGTTTTSTTMTSDGGGGGAGCDPECSAPCTTCEGGRCVDVPYEAMVECGNAQVCAGGACKPVNGQLCSSDTDCASGYCTDGVCCVVDLCNPPCNLCNVSEDGTCNDVTPGMQGACNDISVCNDDHICKRLAGYGCTIPDDCLSNLCEGPPGRMICG